MYQEELIEQQMRNNASENAVYEPAEEPALNALVMKPGPTIKIKTVKKRQPLNEIENVPVLPENIIEKVKKPRAPSKTKKLLPPLEGVIEGPIIKAKRGRKPEVEPIAKENIDFCNFKLNIRFSA